MQVKFEVSRGSFKPVHDIGRPIFDISLVARFRGDASAHKLITGIQENAQGINGVHVVEGGVSHLTLLKPVFIKEFGEGARMVPEGEKEGHFDDFQAALRFIEARAALRTMIILEAFEISIGESNVKLSYLDPQGKVAKIQDKLESVLRGRKELFEASPRSKPYRSTVLRFAPGLDEAGYDKMVKKIESFAYVQPDLLSTQISFKDMFAVRFDALFKHWVEEEAVF